MSVDNFWKKWKYLKPKEKILLECFVCDPNGCHIMCNILIPWRLLFQDFYGIIFFWTHCIRIYIFTSQHGEVLRDIFGFLPCKQFS